MFVIANGTGFSPDCRKNLTNPTIPSHGDWVDEIYWCETVLSGKVPRLVPQLTACALFRPLIGQCPWRFPCGPLILSSWIHAKRASKVRGFWFPITLTFPGRLLSVAFFRAGADANLHKQQSIIHETNRPRLLHNGCETHFLFLQLSSFWFAMNSPYKSWANLPLKY